MNLIIDIGNTRTKMAVVKKEQVFFVGSFKKCSVTQLKAITRKYPQIKNAILSSVVNHDKKINSYLNKNYRFIEFTHLTKLPIKNKYATPTTLGKDRLACAVAANFFCRNKNVLSVDAGTCIKYDFVNDKNEYTGGAISPGLEMRFKALQHFTDKLPLVSYQDVTRLVGKSTKESILTGVVVATAEEIKGMIERYKAEYPHLQVIITGGSLDALLSNFTSWGNKKSSIFADPYLLIRGLNHILNYNIN